MANGERWPRPIEFICSRLNQMTSYWQVIPPRPGPRNILLVHCHPLDSSFSAALASTVYNTLTSQGHNVRFRRLYESSQEAEDEHANIYITSQDNGLTNFNPSLSALERKHYYSIAGADPPQGTPPMSPDVKQACQDLQWAQDLVFVYPTWWFGVPGTLKGFIDRTFLPEVAFRLPKSSDAKTSSTGLVPLLTNIERVAVVTTYGAPEYIVPLAGDAGRMLFGTHLRPLFSSDCTLSWMGLHAMDSTTTEQRQGFLAKVKESFLKF